MPSLSVSCSRCGATNEPGGERCYRCGQPFYVQMLLLPAEQGRQRRGMSRRTALWTLMGIGIAALPVSAGVGYLTYRKLTDPHILTYSGQGTTTLDAAWSPDSTRVASSGWLDGGTVQIWNATTGKTLQTCRTDHAGPEMVPLDVVWSADGKNVLAFVGGGTMSLTPGSRIVEMVQVWDATTGQRVRSIPVMEPVTVNALGTDTDRPLVRDWALNERYLATVNAQDQGSLKIWEIATGTNIATLSAESQHPASQARRIAWSPDNEKLAIQWFAQVPAGQNFQTIEIWNIATLSKIAVLNTTSPDYATSLNWSPDSKMLVLVGFEEGASAKSIYEIWHVLAGTKLQTLQPRYFEPSLPIWSPNGKYLALGSEVYSVETGNRIAAYPPSQGTVTSLAWSPDGTRVALVDTVEHGHTLMSGSSATLYILDALSGRQRAGYAGGGLFGNSGTSGKLVWSPDGKYVMVVGQQVDIWRGE